MRSQTQTIRLCARHSEEKELFEATDWKGENEIKEKSLVKIVAGCSSGKKNWKICVGGYKRPTGKYV